MIIYGTTFYSTSWASLQGNCSYHSSTTSHTWSMNLLHYDKLLTIKPTIVLILTQTTKIKENDCALQNCHNTKRQSSPYQMACRRIAATIIASFFNINVTFYCKTNITIPLEFRISQDRMPCLTCIFKNITWIIMLWT